MSLRSLLHESSVKKVLAMDSSRKSGGIKIQSAAVRVGPVLQIQGRHCDGNGLQLNVQSVSKIGNR